MTRITIDELKRRRMDAMSANERAAFDEAYEASRLAMDVGEKVRAAREAMVNAAKHSGADKIDVYAEVDEESVEVFVRDRGKGFDVEAVAEDRLGIKGSVIDRMARHGGSATIRSAPGDGTEVRLEIKR